MTAMGDFDDLLGANRLFAEKFELDGFDGLAHRGVAVLTCMDSRIEPLDMFGLVVGDAKIMRTPGGRLTDDALIGCIVAVHLLRVRRIMIVPHTKCAMASGVDADIAQRILDRRGIDVGDLRIGADPHQLDRLRDDVRTLKEHPLISDSVSVGGFRYDVDTGLVEQIC